MANPITFLTETLTETVKSFLKNDDKKELSSEISPIQIRTQTEETLTPYTGGFFDAVVGQNGHVLLSDKATLLELQKNKIMMYRSIARDPGVDDALEEIVNEVIFSTDSMRTVECNVDIDNDKIKEAVNKSFDKITKLLDLDRNFFSLVRNSFVDGQIVVLMQYDKNSTKNGIQKIKIIEPSYFYYDTKEEMYKYIKKQDGQFGNMGGFYGNDVWVFGDESYSKEEIVREDFGLYNNGLIESYLEKAIKPANQLKTLEDLLIPMRFSRSISRRVFNIDIADLPPKKGEEVMKDIQNKFKYRKHYNVETGEVTGQNHITSMVEDYWFANRSGAKGTSVDVLDETGNLGELGDIIYFTKKLYRALKIPANRVPFQTDIDATFDYTSSTVSKDDMKFFMFISRLRRIYISTLEKILKRELISSSVFSEQEYDKVKENIEIYFTNENKFIEKMKLDAWTSKLDIWTTISSYSGNIFSYKYCMKEIFGLTDEEIDTNLKEIEKEKTNKLFKRFYQTPEDE